MDSPLDIVLVGEYDYRIDPSDALELSKRYFGGPLLGDETRDFERTRPTPPQFGIVALGTWLRREGFRVSLHDNVFTVPAARDAFFAALERQPLAVGISASLMVNPATAERLCAWARERCPRALIVLGGASGRREEFRRHADATVVGAGEKTLTSLLGRLREGRDWRDLDNIVYREGGSEIRGRVVPDLQPDEIPAPDWDLLEPRLGLTYSIEASKGCRYNCAFCGFPDRGNQRMRAIPLVVSEMRRSFERYGARLFRFTDSNLTSWPDYTEEMCQALARENLPVEWSCYGRVDDFARRPSLAASMRAAGCRWIFIGVESGSNAVLRGMRKGYEAPAALRGAGYLRDAGIRVHANFVVGFPGETRATVDETLELVGRARFDTTQFFVLALGLNASIDASSELYGVRGKATNWSHATMDSETARAECRRCVDFVTHELEETFIGSEKLSFYMLRSTGFTEAEIFSFYRDVRECHRAERRGDAAALRSARARVEAVWERDRRFLDASIGTPRSFRAR